MMHEGKALSYRGVEIVIPPQRPVLSRWQRLMTRVLGHRCARWRWFRAAVGGRWARMFGRWVLMRECPARWVPQWTGCLRDWRVYREARELVEEHEHACSCEVYPWRALAARGGRES